MKTKLKNSAGFGMIEVLMMSGILAIFSMAMMGLSASLSKQNKYANVNNGARALTSTLVGIVSYPNLCKNHLQAATSVFNSSMATSQQGMPMAFAIEGNTLIARDNEELKEFDLKVTSLRFKVPSPLTSAGPDTSISGNNLYVGHLYLGVENRASSEPKLGGQYMKVRSIGTLTVSVNPTTSRIDNCFALMDMKQACVDIGGTYNSNAVPKCKLPYPCAGTSSIFLGYDASGYALCKGVAQLTGENCPDGSFIVSNGNGKASCKDVNSLVAHNSGGRSGTSGTGTSGSDGTGSTVNGK